MMPRFGGALLCAVLPLLPQPAIACSCLGPSGARLLAPSRVDDAPINAHVRVAVARRLYASPGGAADFAVELRRAGGEVVATTATTVRVQDSWEDVIDLVPSIALHPNQTYVVSWLTKGQWPDTLVLGAFKTAAVADHEAPVLGPLAAPELPSRSPTLRSTCDSGQPWARWKPDVHDPGRPRATLAFAVWLGDAKGNFDVSQAPTALLENENGLEIGRSSSCDRSSFSLPARSSVWVGIAAVDEAGNRSAVQKIRVPVVRPK